MGNLKNLCQWIEFLWGGGFSIPFSDKSSWEGPKKWSPGSPIYGHRIHGEKVGDSPHSQKKPVGNGWLDGPAVLKTEFMVIFGDWE
jgi:hypothetical protein